MLFTYFLIMLVCLVASIIGSICGIGGGVIIKPVLDSMGIMSVNTITFLSGFTVLCMSSYSVIMAGRFGEAKVKLKIGMPVSMGAVAGGILGKMAFSAVLVRFTNSDLVGAIQAACLFILTFGTLLFTINKKKIRTYRIANIAACILSGLILGFLSAFLGIGGGPFNLVLLFFLFSMETKEAAYTSLFIIMFSQLAALCLTVMEGQIPNFNAAVLLAMAFSGILGAAIGKNINRKIDTNMVDKLFAGLILVIMLICIYNFAKYI